MIKSKHIVFGFIGLSMLLYSCNKHQLDIAIDKKNATEFSQLQISDHFNWSNYHTIQINYSPIQPQELTTIIKVKDSKGNLLLSRNLNPSEFLNAKIILPIHENRIVIQIGRQEFQKQIDSKTNFINLYP